MKKTNYSNRTVKSDEELFAPDDPDVDLVGGKSQVDPFGYLKVQERSNVDFFKTASAVDDEKYDPEEESPESEEEEEFEEEKLGSVTIVTFEQIGRFTGDGTYLADVTAIIGDVKGATQYEVEFQKLS
jgi:hypothetical protein